MTSVENPIAGAVGAGLGMATLWFPITYFGMQKQLRFGADLGQLWSPYGICVVLFGAMDLLGLVPSTHTPFGLALFVTLPILICAGVLLYANPKR